MTEKSTRGYGTVHKAMAVISAFSYGDPVLGVSELSRRLGLGKSTVHRILTTCVGYGLIERTRPPERPCRSATVAVPPDDGDS